MQHLFHMITSLDMIQLYLTLKTKIKIKIPGTPPSLEQAKGMPIPEEIYSSFLFLSVTYSLAKRFHGTCSPVSKDIPVSKILHSAPKPMRRNFNSYSQFWFCRS